MLWAHCRQYGEKFNDVIRREVESFFRSRGIDAAAPYCDERGKRYEDDERILGANWSERHAMYAAGLGTFSLSDGLITDRGIAMRCGSVVAAVALEPSSKPTESHTGNCLFYARGSCGDCIDRCPADAITEKGHDKREAESTLCFEVDRKANKVQIKAAIEALLKVKVEEVRTVNQAGKLRRQGRFEGYRPNWKKAYVKLKAGEKMPEYAEI